MDPLSPEKKLILLRSSLMEEVSPFIVNYFLDISHFDAIKAAERDLAR